eukprot:scaffold151860_cov27-Tisochrysis_lutea.AAC.2
MGLIVDSKSIISLRKAATEDDDDDARCERLTSLFSYLRHRTQWIFNGARHGGCRLESVGAWQMQGRGTEWACHNGNQGTIRSQHTVGRAQHTGEPPSWRER